MASGNEAETPQTEDKNMAFLLAFSLAVSSLHSLFLMFCKADHIDELKSLNHLAVILLCPTKPKSTHTHTNKSSTILLKQNQKNGILSAKLIESPKTHAKASNPNPVLQSSSSSLLSSQDRLVRDEEAPSLLDLSSSASRVHFRHLLHFSGKEEEGEEETGTKDRRERERGAGGGIV
jgi:hypothetical protein